MSYKLTLKFPEIDRQVDATCTPAYGSWSGHLNFGCHVAGISDISLKVDWNTLRTLAGATLKEGPYSVVPAKDLEDVKKALTTYTIPYDWREETYKKIVDGYNHHYQHDTSNWGPKEKGMPSGSSIVFLADNINSWTPEFNKSSGIADTSKVPYFKTSDFVEWLVRTRTGIVVGCPVGRNQYHQDSLNYSMTQGWMWIPPNFAKYTVPDSHFISGLENQPTIEKWYADTKAACKKETMTNEALDSRLWRNGRHNSHLEALNTGGK